MQISKVPTVCDATDIDRSIVAMKSGGCRTIELDAYITHSTSAAKVV